MFSERKGETGFTPGDGLTGAGQPDPGEKHPDYFHETARLLMLRPTHLLIYDRQ